MALAGGGNAGAASIIEAFHGVGGDVRLGIEIIDAMAGRPGDTVLQRNAAAQINTDPMLEAHRLRPSSQQPKVALFPAAKALGVGPMARGPALGAGAAPAFRQRTAQGWPILTAPEWPADCRAAF